MSTVILSCGNCLKTFHYATKEHNRQTKKGRNVFFCSRGCACSYKNTHMPVETRAAIAKKLALINQGNQYNLKGEFTWYLTKARQRDLASDIDDDYLKSIWNGKCALSGVPIYKKKGKCVPLTGSLDRIDSSKGYIRGNVQFVAYSINLGKNVFSNDEIRELIDLIVKSS